MSKHVAILPTAALALALLAGCGSGSQATGDDSLPEETESASVTAAAAEHLTAESGDEYARSVQTWSPYMELWRVDGTSVTYTEINCLGDAGEVTPGTWTDDTITWEGRSPIHGAGMGNTSSMEPLTEDTLHRVGARESATSDIEGQLTAHIEKCKEVGETVGGILLG